MEHIIVSNLDRQNILYDLSEAELFSGGMSEWHSPGLYNMDLGKGGPASKWWMSLPVTF